MWCNRDLRVSGYVYQHFSYADSMVWWKQFGWVVVSVRGLGSAFFFLNEGYFGSKCGILCHID